MGLGFGHMATVNKTGGGVTFAELKPTKIKKKKINKIAKVNIKYVGQGLLRGRLVTWAAPEATQLYKCIMRTSVNTQGWFISDKSAAKRLNYNNNTRASGNTKSPLCRPHMWKAAASSSSSSSSSPSSALSDQHHRGRGSGIQTLEPNESASGCGRRTDWHKLKLAGLWTARLAHRASSPALVLGCRGQIGLVRMNRSEQRAQSLNALSSVEVSVVLWLPRVFHKASIKVVYSMSSLYNGYIVTKKMCGTSMWARAPTSSIIPPYQG